MRLLYEQLTDIPVGFTEVEYLECTGTQYIDTGVYRTDNGLSTGDNLTSFSFKGVIEYTSMGVRRLMGDNSAHNGFWGIAANNKFETGSTSTYVASANTKYNIDFTATTTDLTLVVKLMNGTEVVNFTRSATVPSKVTNATFDIFALGGNFINSGTRVYKYQVLINNNLLRDFVPCLDSSNVPCMWDKVEGKAYYNAGTGTFTYGRKIIPVEYLESSGTQYIDLGLKGKNGYDFDYKFNSTRIDGTAYGIGGEWESNKSCYLGLIRNTNYFAYHYRSTSTPVEVQLLTANTDYTVQAHLYSGEQYYVINGTKSAVGTLSGTFESTTNMNLFRVNSSSPIYSYIKVYYLKIKDNNILVRDYIPCIDENNVGFMFDKVTHTCYLNAGSGSFVVGDELPRKKVRFLKEANARPYYCELEYLEANGTQYINTGLLSTASSKVDAVFGFTSMESGVTNNCAVFGGRNNTTSQTFTLFKLASTNPQKFRFDYNNQSDIGTASNLTWNTTSKYRFTYDGSTGKTDNITTGESASTQRSPGSTFTTSPITLFAVNTNGGITQYMSGRIYKYWYTDGTNTIDLIPVLDWSYTPCFYDKVSGQFFYNAGTGTFTYGREIHYVNYLESTGTQYIDTGYAFQDDFAWEIDFEGIPDNTTLFGGRTSSSRTALLYQRVEGTITSTLPIAGYNGAATPFQLANLNDDNRHKVKMAVASNKGSVWVDGSQVYNEQAFTGTYISGTTQALFADKFGNNDYREQTSSKVYALKMWQGVNIVRDYQPAIDENGVGFMFDKVAHTCFLNAGTGAFKYPAVECEYLEVTDLGTNYKRPCLDLGLKYKSSMSIEGKYTRTAQGDAGSIFPLSTTTTNPLIYFPALDAGQMTDRFVFRRSGYAEQRKDKTFASYPVTTSFKLDAVNDVFYIDGVSAKTGMIAGMGGYTSPYESSSNLYMLSINGSYGGLGKVYPLKIYDTTQVYRDLIPAWKDGSFGMYDKEHDVLYTNTQTGTIVAGRIKERKNAVIRFMY